MKVESKHPDFDGLKRRRMTGNLLMDGQQAMRDNASFTIPQEQRETDENYKARVNRSVLFNAYRKTVNDLILKPFSEPVTFETEPDKTWAFINENLPDKLKTMVEHELRYGHTVTVVGMPALPAGISEIERQKQGLNPYWRQLDPDSLISWFYEGKELAFAKIQYQVEKNEDGDVIKAKRIDVIDREQTTTYEQTEDESEWKAIDTKPNPIGRVSLVIGGSLYDISSLENLAELNLQHFRKSSDKDNILHMACCPFLLFSGWDKDDIEATVSVNNAYVSSNPESKLEWVEVSGAGIEQSAKDIERLEAKLMVAGADLLTEKQVKTATEKVMDNDDKMSTLQAIVTKVEKTFNEIVSLMADWLNVPDPELVIEIYKDFNITQQVKDEVDLLLKARMNGDISRETFLHELKRRKLFNDSFDIDEEVGRLEDNGEL